MNLDNKVIKFNRYAIQRPEVKFFSDCLKVKKFIELNGSINRCQASDIGINRLAARIWDLRNKYNLPIMDHKLNSSGAKVYRMGRLS